MKKLLILMATMVLAVPVFAQSAAPQRVAVIDVQRVLASSAAGKTAQERLKKVQEDKMARAAKIQEEMKALESEIATKKLSLSEDKIAELQKHLAEKQLNLQRFGQDADRELGEARDKALLELEGRIKPVIDQIGKEMGLAAIFNKFESGLVYASEAIDITDTVIKRFNEATASASATPPPAPAPAKKQ
jgi:outer membrane protein